MAFPVLPAQELSAWHDPEHAEEPDTYPRLHGTRRVDVAVVGAGITGLTTAVLLAREGLQVAVLEARRLGAVATGNTTAKISLLQGTRAATLDARHDQDTVDAYLAAHRAGFDWLLDRARSADCDLERRAAVTFSAAGRSSAGAEAVRREAAVLRRAGVPAVLGTDVGLPFGVSEAVTLPDQAQFDPMPYLADLAQELHERGHPVYERTRVRGVSLFGGPRLRTDDGEVRAERVVLATGVPVLDRGLYFARVEPARSYAQAVRVDGPLPEAMYLGADDPTVSLRTAVIEGERRLLTGGFGHRVGASTPTSAHERALADWTARHFDVRTVTHRWSAQDYLPEDGLPFVGPMPWQPRVLVATGFAKWGMTGGTAAGLALRDLVVGRRNPWSAALRADRAPAAAALPALARANGQVGRYLATGWARPHLPAREPLPEGEGRIETTSRGKVARCRVGGVEHELGAVCPHLGGILAWNDAAGSWDCPLHGSRFAPDGDVLEGPATAAMPPAPPGLARVVAPR
ncbi:FAD-dependent oxidoreductase [Actinomycetospora sp. NBRC 106375]|uniref:FAD-dependent oxidoreductase n=1 Tax=Actinomycetospora sp. NBRC 106375 TaxID=3032207 RepID=UPI0024A30A7F|nr:FAD-dependent oxidoreductase [Actinomycetospora sp. NBRC 106375]GLZ50301.1 FAD-dependent oxidoreductase [Actinomycetospora sp. NBRC 106375]